MASMGMLSSTYKQLLVLVSALLVLVSALLVLVSALLVLAKVQNEPEYELNTSNFIKYMSKTVGDVIFSETKAPVGRQSVAKSAQMVDYP
jgi:hypothetical protein